jgi:hypothetical protein
MLDEYTPATTRRHASSFGTDLAATRHPVWSAAVARPTTSHGVLTGECGGVTTVGIEKDSTGT